jgi:broad specificity phosphatase PhoE
MNGPTDPSLRPPDSEASSSAVASAVASGVVVKHLLCVRHGISIANERMNLPGNQWGDPNFRDDGLSDSPLSEAGKQRTQTFLKEQLLVASSGCCGGEDGGGDSSSSSSSCSRLLLLAQTLQRVELVAVSPLTRCLETVQYGVLPCLPRTVPILAVPLLRERVYTTSDTGRPASHLAAAFPAVDFSALPQDDSPWWYHVAAATDGEGECGDDEEENGTEWRPHGEHQWYGVPGEPEDVFEERMKALDDWIANRPERTLLLVTHWGVLRHLTDGTQFENAEAKVLVHRFCPVQRTSTISHLD